MAVAATTKKSILEMLNEAPPAEALSTRKGPGGRTFTYLTGGYVIKRANEVFGPGGWSLVDQSVEAAEGGYIGSVLLSVAIEGREITRPGTGFCDGTGETAIKGAATDAMKRAFMTLGPTFGLDLYPAQADNSTPAASGYASSGGAERMMSDAQKGFIVKLAVEREYSDAVIAAIETYKNKVVFDANPDVSPSVEFTPALTSFEASKLIGELKEIKTS